MKTLKTPPKTIKGLNNNYVFIHKQEGKFIAKLIETHNGADFYQCEDSFSSMKAAENYAYRHLTPNIHPNRNR